MAIPKSNKDREQFKFVESPTRPDRSAVETTVTNTVNVNVVEDGEDGSVINVFNNVNSVASGALTNIIQYTVPVDKVFYLKLVEVSGTNIARYDVLFDASINARKRTYYTRYNEEFDFSRVQLTAGQVITIRVEHNSPMVGDFDARLTGNLS